MKFRPCIDLHEGYVKQIVGETFKDGSKPQTNFISNHPPSWFAKTYLEDGFKEGHIIKLGDGNDNAAKEALSVSPNTFQIGGGITLENAEQWLEAGASAVIITSWLFTNGQIDEIKLHKLVKAIGKEHIVIDLSCRKKDGIYYVVADRWQTYTNTIFNADTLHELSNSCSEFLVHAVDVEGLKSGIDSNIIHILSSHSPISSVYAGGIQSIEDLEYIQKIGKNQIDVTIGSSLDLFGGNLEYEKITNFFNQKL